MAATLPAPPFFARAERLSKSPVVCQALFSRSFDNDDLLPRIRKPTFSQQAQSVLCPVRRLAEAQIHAAFTPWQNQLTVVVYRVYNLPETHNAGFSLIK
jgi:hypothetical protein